ncbi:helix-turn-helix domain-containing protein [Porticoccaceae bacterium]|nr:helix-turn-helix domain-containing protein [Porticoccaceae bacterium]
MSHERGNRLREERRRLGLTQEALAALGGVKRNSQVKYEQGERNPDSGYLAAISGAVDILYVISGDRIQAPNPVQRSTWNDDLERVIRQHQKTTQHLFEALLSIDDPSVAEPDLNPLDHLAITISDLKQMLASGLDALDHAEKYLQQLNQQGRTK